MNKLILAGLVLALAACGEDKKEKKPSSPSTISGFEFEIQIEPSTFAPSAAEPVRIASDGDPAGNPAQTVQLYTPNNTLTWLANEDGDFFGFDVELTNFYSGDLCAVQVVVDEIEPADGHTFLDDDRGTSYAGEVTGAGVWAYGDVASGAMYSRRWKIKLEDRDRFTIRGRVLADDENCGAKPPEEE
jgi:hypothetical protein